MAREDRHADYPGVGDLVKEIFSRDIGVVIDTDTRRDHHYLPRDLYLYVLFTKSTSATSSKWIRADDCSIVSRGAK